MMKGWPKYAISHRSVSLTGLFLCIYMGLSSFMALPRRDMPYIPAPVARVVTYYPGASARDVETLVTKKLEQSFTAIDGVKSVSSTSKPGVSILTVELVYGVKTRPRWDKLRNKVEELRQELPQNVIGPNINDEFSDTAIMLLAVYGKNYSYRELKEFSKQIRDQLKRLDAVGKVEIVGTQDEQINLYAKRELTAKSLPSFWKISRTLRSKNIIFPGAQVLPSQLQVKLKTSGRVRDVNGLKALILSRNPQSGQVVRVKELFDVKRGYKRPQSLIRYHGNPAVVLGITMRPRENVIKLGRSISRSLTSLRAMLPKDLNITKVTDQPKLVSQSVLGFLNNLLQAIVIVLFVAMLFMGFRPGLIMAVAIPLSMFLSFTIMEWVGWDLQQISIAALIIALGMLVDNAIVITDNIYTKLQDGAGRFDAAWQGASELAVPVLMSTLTTVAIFFPLALMPSLSGDFIRSIPVVVGIVLSASFFVAMTVTPLMSFYLLKANPKHDGAQEPKQPGVLGRMYLGLLSKALGQPGLVLVVAAGCFAVALGGFAMIGKEFFPKAERDLFTVDVWLPEGRAIEATLAAVKRIEGHLGKEKGIQTYTSFVGEGPPRFDLGSSPEARSPNYAQILVRTKDASLTPGIAARLQKDLSQTLAGVRVSVKEFKRGPSVSAPVQIRVYGEDLRVLRDLSEKIKRHLRAIPGTYDISDTAGYKIFNLDVKVDDYRASLVGLDNITVAKVLKMWVEGYSAGTVIDGDDELPILIRARSLVRERLGIFQNASLPVSAEQSSASAPLIELVTLQPRWDDARIDRRNNQRYVTISSQVNGILASEVLNRLRPVLKKLDVPAGYRTETAGEEEKRSEGFANLSKAMVLGILLILLLLVIQFNSFRHTAIILGTLPLSMIGAIIGLFATGNAFGFMAFLGVVSLCGVVVNNALILLDDVQGRLREGTHYLQALQESGLRRMRPILLTTTTTIGGLLPLFFSGGAMWTPMAAVLIFGLAVSTLLTLVVIPCMYAVLVKDREQLPS